MEENKRFVDTCIKALNERNLAALNRILAAQGIECESKAPEARDRGNLRQWFADLHASALESAAPAAIFVDWDQVAENWTLSRRGIGTRAASPTLDSGMMLVRFAGGEIVEGWLVDDKEFVHQSTLSPVAPLRFAQVAE